MAWGGALNTQGLLLSGDVITGGVKKGGGSARLSLLMNTSGLQPESQGTKMLVSSSIKIMVLQALCPQGFDINVALLCCPGVPSLMHSTNRHGGASCAGSLGPHSAVPVWLALGIIQQCSAEGHSQSLGATQQRQMCHSTYKYMR